MAHINRTSDNWIFQRRQWGWMIKFWHSKTVWVKMLKVNTQTSVQSHANRIEYHISFGKIKKIEMHEVHQMTKGLYIEIALGYPTEADIIRY